MLAYNWQIFWGAPFNLIWCFCGVRSASVDLEVSKMLCGCDIILVYSSDPWRWVHEKNYSPNTNLIKHHRFTKISWIMEVIYNMSMINVINTKHSGSNNSSDLMAFSYQFRHIFWICWRKYPQCHNYTNGIESLGLNDTIVPAKHIIIYLW